MPRPPANSLPTQEVAQLNVAALHAAVKARQNAHAAGAAALAGANGSVGGAGGGTAAGSAANGHGDSAPGSGTQGGGSSSTGSTNPSNAAHPDPKKAVLNAVSALGNMDADKVRPLPALLSCCSAALTVLAAV